MATHGTPVRISSSQTLSLIPCQLVGMITNSTAGGTVTLYDATSATGTPFQNTLSTTAGAYRAIPAATAIGLHCVIAGTCDVTFFVAGCG